MFMYHSFPSKGGSAQAGLSVLKSIARHGLLLTPEDFEVGIDWPDGYQETVGFAQTRICFTLIASEELPQHAESFGPFAIEYDVSVLKRLGANPVFSLVGGGTEIVGSLMTLNDLIAELRSDAPEFAQGWDEKPHTRSLDHLQASIHGLSGYFYPVGSCAYEDDVRYFLERE